jgi:hypothetical protein
MPARKSTTRGFSGCWVRISGVLSRAGGGQEKAIATYELAQSRRPHATFRSSTVFG